MEILLLQDLTYLGLPCYLKQFISFGTFQDQGQAWPDLTSRSRPWAAMGGQTGQAGQAAHGQSGRARRPRPAIAGRDWAGLDWLGMPGLLRKSVPIENRMASHGWP